MGRGCGRVLSACAAAFPRSLSRAAFPAQHFPRSISRPATRREGGPTLCGGGLSAWGGGEERGREGASDCDWTGARARARVRARACVCRRSRGRGRGREGRTERPRRGEEGRVGGFFFGRCAPFLPRARLQSAAVSHRPVGRCWGCALWRCAPLLPPASRRRAGVSAPASPRRRSPAFPRPGRL